MSKDRTRAFDPQPWWVGLWFVVDAVVALAPPLHWIDEGAGFVFGLPVAMIYFVAVGVCICFSIIAAFWAEIVPEGAR